MTYTLNYLYAILIVLISVFYFYKYRSKRVIENFAQMKLPSFDKFQKMSAGYNCSRDMDSMNSDVVKDYNINTFCNENPNELTIDKLSTVLIDGPLEIKRTKIRMFKTNDLNVNVMSTGTMFKENNSMVLSYASANSKLDNYNLMEDECVAKCNENEICEYSMIVNPSTTTGSNKKLGKCYLYNNKLDRTKIKQSNIVNNSSLYRKIKTIEFSLTFWMKIDKLAGRSRNIFSHGNSNYDRWPSIWITPNNTGVKFSMRTQEKTTTEYPDGIDIPQTNIQLKKWHHVGFTVSGKVLKGYINGKLVISRTLANYAIWPTDNRNVYISDPWNATGGFTLSKMKWYPFNLSENFIESLAYSSFPLAKFSRDLALIKKKKKGGIVLGNNWVEDVRIAHVPLQAKIHNGIVFLNGVIKNGQINGIMGYLPSNAVPDRNISVIVGGSNGPYRLEIKTNGEMRLHDAKTKINRSMWLHYGPVRYIRGEFIYLSNIRYPISKGSAFNLRSGATAALSYPTYVRKGSIIYLTGGFNGNGPWPIRIPNGIRPTKADMFQSLSSTDNKLCRLDIRRWGGILNAFRYKQKGISIEGINYSYFNGERLSLKNGFHNYSGSNGYWSYAQVTMDNSVVTLRGLIYKGNYGERNNGLTKQPKSVKRFWHNKGLTANFGYRNKNSCANAALRYGLKFIKRSRSGYCRAGKYYNLDKPNWNKFKKDMLAISGIKMNGQNLEIKVNRNSKTQVSSKDYNAKAFDWGKFYNNESLRLDTVYRLNDRYELITVLPKKYWPETTHIFTTNCHVGVAVISIDIKGNVVLMDRIGTYWGGISLAGISYLVDPVKSMRN